MKSAVCPVFGIDFQTVYPKLILITRSSTHYVSRESRSHKFHIKIDFAQDQTVYWLFTLGTVYSCSIVCF